MIIYGGTLVKCHAKEKLIVVPSGIKVIGENAFGWEHEVEEVILPTEVAEIQENAFYHKVKRISIQSGVNKLGRGAFSSDEIEDLVLPEGISEIPSRAFGLRLRSITIPSGVIRIGNAAFNMCSKLRTINYQGSKEQWKRYELGSTTQFFALQKRSITILTVVLLAKRNQFETNRRSAMLIALSEYLAKKIIEHLNSITIKRD